MDIIMFFNALFSDLEESDYCQTNVL